MFKLWCEQGISVTQTRPGSGEKGQEVKPLNLTCV